MDGDDCDGFQNSSQNVPHDDEDDDEEVMFLNLSTARPPANGCAVLPTTSATNSSPSFTLEVIFCLLHTTLACGESASMNRGSYLGALSFYGMRELVHVWWILVYASVCVY